VRFFVRDDNKESVHSHLAEVIRAHFASQIGFQSYKNVHVD